MLEVYSGGFGYHGEGTEGDEGEVRSWWPMRIMTPLNLQPENSPPCPTA
jgi:hypothetical protein